MRFGAHPAFPLPWASDASSSFVETPDAYLAAADAAGFGLVARRDRGEVARDFFARMQEAMAAGRVPPVGLPLLMGEAAPHKIANMVAAVGAGDIQPVEMIFRNRSQERTMADLRSDFVGIKSPNPFWLASAPPTDKEYNVRRAFEAGWGGVVWKTLGLDPHIVNVNGPRYGAIWGADRRLLGLNNIELITDRPLEVNLREIKAVKRDWPDRAMVVSPDGPRDEASWKSILPLVEETGADGVELNFGCPHGMCERGMGSAVGQVPEYIEMVARWCKANTRMPVIVKLTPNITDIRHPARAAFRGGADAVVAHQHDELDHRRRPRHLQPRALDRRQGLARRLLRAGGEADRAPHGGRDRPRRRDLRQADLRHRRDDHLARRGGVHRARRRHGAGLHRGDDLRLPRGAGDDLGPRRSGWTTTATPTSTRSAGGRCRTSPTGST